MSFLALLPQQITVRLASEWLLGRDVAKIDAAFTNKTSRRIILNNLLHPRCYLELHRPANSKCKSWLCARNFRSKFVIVSETDRMDWVCACLATSKSVQIGNSTLVVDWMAKGMLSSLRELSIKYKTVNDILLLLRSVPKSFVALEGLNLNCDSLALLDQTASHEHLIPILLFFKQVQLTEFSLKGYSSLSCSLKLRSLTFGQVRSAVVFDVLVEITRSFPELLPCDCAIDIMFASSMVIGCFSIPASASLADLEECKRVFTGLTGSSAARLAITEVMPLIKNCVHLVRLEIVHSQQQRFSMTTQAVAFSHYGLSLTEAAIEAIHECRGAAVLSVRFVSCTMSASVIETLARLYGPTLKTLELLSCAISVSLDNHRLETYLPDFTSLNSFVTDIKLQGPLRTRLDECVSWRDRLEVLQLSGTEIYEQDAMKLLQLRLLRRLECAALIASDVKAAQVFRHCPEILLGSDSKSFMQWERGTIYLHLRYALVYANHMIQTHCGSCWGVLSLLNAPVAIHSNLTEEEVPILMNRLAGPQAWMKYVAHAAFKRIADVYVVTVVWEQCKPPLYLVEAVLANVRNLEKFQVVKMFSWQRRERSISVSDSRCLTWEGLRELLSSALSVSLTLDSPLRPEEWEELNCCPAAAAVSLDSEHLSHAILNRMFPNFSSISSLEMTFRCAQLRYDRLIEDCRRLKSLRLSDLKGHKLRHDVIARAIESNQNLHSLHLYCSDINSNDLNDVMRKGMDVRIFKKFYS